MYSLLSTIAYISNVLILKCSQFEEKFEEVNGAEPPVSFPLASSSESNEHPVTEVVNVDSTGKEIEPQAPLAHQMCSDMNVSQEFAGGMMKIVPSNVDVSINDSN